MVNTPAAPSDPVDMLTKPRLPIEEEATPGPKLGLVYKKFIPVNDEELADPELPIIIFILLPNVGMMLYFLH